jgi:hypothetical protein
MKPHESLMELAYDTPLHDFWIYIRKKYVKLSEIDVLVFFGLTYFREKSFSPMTAIKSKHRNRLQL